MTQKNLKWLETMKVLTTSLPYEGFTWQQIYNKYINIIREVRIIGSCNNFQFLPQDMVFESQLVLRRVCRVQGFENNFIITYRKTAFSIYLSVSYHLFSVSY